MSEDTVEEPTQTFDATDDETASERITILSELTDELQDLDVGTETYPVPARAGYAVRYQVNPQMYETLVRLRKRAADKKHPGGFNLLQWQCLILGEMCDAIIRRGEELTEDGEPVTFRSDSFKELVGGSTVASTVRKFYGRDGDVSKAAEDLLAAAGYTSDPYGNLEFEDELGPTDG